MNNLHADILLALHGAGKFGLKLDNLIADLRRGRHRGLTVPQLESAARELADRSLVAPFESALGEQRWRITQLGTSSLQEEALI